MRYQCLKTFSLTITVALFYLLTKPSYATSSPPIIDVYLSKKVSSKMLEHKFHNEFKILSEILSSPEFINPNISQDRYASIYLKLIAEINKLGNFSFVNISPIMYPEIKNIYFTVDIVDKDDAKRQIQFLPKPTGTIADPDHLIQEWQNYQKLGFDLVYKTKVSPKFNACSAYHCVFGFDNPKFKPYEIKFNTLVPKNKLQLVNVLRNDKDDHKRAVAAFLLAHIKDPNELITILVPSMYDSSGSVRNNAMRVLGAVLAKVKNADFPIEQAVIAFNFPLETDRNKASFIILPLVSQPRYANYIKIHAKQELLAELKMRQPNVHDTAYDILKKMSGKHYADRDYQAWQRLMDTWPNQ